MDRLEEIRKRLGTYRDYNVIEDDIRWLLAEVDRLGAALNSVAEKAYQSDVLETGMKEHWIGEGKEYADKADWINDWLCQFFEM